ncbi:MAG: hypothetical protein ACKVH8_14145 [Pirellulales bacterium]|jgi:hypothetical protein
MNHKKLNQIALALVVATTFGTGGMVGVAYFTQQPIDVTLPPADVPHDLRVENYWGGSCYHASAQVALRWADQGSVADRWRESFGRGATTSMITSKLDHFGVGYEVTHRGNIEVLDFAHNTRRVAAITYYPRHAISFLGWAVKDGQEYPVVLDNNRIDGFIFIKKQPFLNDWRNRYGGSAIVPLVEPPPHNPYNPRDFEI